MRLIVATHNPNKIREISQMLPDFDIAGEDSSVEENGATFVENALIKVRAVVARHPDAWVLADDSGLEVDALNGAPGIRSARYAGEDGNTAANNALLLRNMIGKVDRTARFTCAMILVDPSGKEHIIESHCCGSIIESPSGVGGFGYDPLFVPDGLNRTFAELSQSEKNSISHRGKALAEVRKILSSV